MVIEDGIVWLDTCASTNDEARSRVDDPSVRAVVAEMQEAGRGRRGRPWTSPQGSGLYLSWIARPRFNARLGAVLPLMAAVAVAEYCAELGALGLVKWPNDLLLGGRKLAGVLCEARGTPEDWNAIVGVGLNLRTPPGGWPSEVPAVALDAVIDTPPSPRVAAAGLVPRLERWLERLAEMGNPYPLLREWEAWAPPRGTPMRRGALEGRFAGLAPDGALRLEVGGTVHTIHAGDVELMEG